MKATLPWLAALVLTAAGSALAQAQLFYPPPMPPQAPDACGPGYYCTNYCGAVYGPNYCLQPPFPPFNGFRPPLNNNNCGNPPAEFPMHPFARSPRDYFMWNDP